MTEASNWTAATTDLLFSKLQELKEQLDDLYEGQEAIKDHLREITGALDDLSLRAEEDEWGV